MVFMQGNWPATTLRVRRVLLHLKCFKTVTLTKLGALATRYTCIRTCTYAPMCNYLQHWKLKFFHLSRNELNFLSAKISSYMECCFLPTIPILWQPTDTDTCKHVLETLVYPFIYCRKSFFINYYNSLYVTIYAYVTVYAPTIHRIISKSIFLHHPLNELLLITKMFIFFFHAICCSQVIRW